MKVIKFNQKLLIEKRVIAQLDNNQLKMVEGGRIGDTNTCVCTWKTCGCTYTCFTIEPKNNRRHR